MWINHELFILLRAYIKTIDNFDDLDHTGFFFGLFEKDRIVDLNTKWKPVSGAFLACDHFLD